MRIAFDARTLNAPKTGDRTVTLGLLRGLLAWAEEEQLELVAITDQPPPAGLLPDSPYLQTHIASKPRSYAWMLMAFPRALRSVGAEVAVLQYMAPFRLPCPYITFIHDTVWRTMPATFPWRDRLILNTFIPATIAHAAAICTGSQFAATEIIRHYPRAAGKTQVIPYGVESRFQRVTNDEELARIRMKYGLPRQFILSLGVLQPRKNVAGLVQAYRLLPTTLREETGLVIVGKHGWLTQNLPELARNAGPGELFTGYADDADLPALYSLATCFAYPSLYEGYGLPPLEAMACETPVLTSSKASLPEVTAGAALLTDPADPVVMAQDLERLLTDHNLRTNLVARGRVKASELTWQSAAKRLLKLLQGITSQGGN